MGDNRVWRTLRRPIVAYGFLVPLLWVLRRNLPSLSLSLPPPSPSPCVCVPLHMVLMSFIGHARDYADDLLAGSATRRCCLALTLTGTTFFRWMVDGGWRPD